MARVMLVNPPWYSLLGMSSALIPVGLINLAGVVGADGHEVTVFNADLFGTLYASDLDVLKGRDSYVERLDNDSDPIWERIRQRLANWEPDIVGVHVKTPSWAAGCKVAKIAKGMSQNILTVCGGPHVSCMPEDVHAESGFDYGIVGEGEVPLVKLIESIAGDNSKMIPGVIKSSESHSGDPMPCQHVSNLDDLPFNGREYLMDLKRYSTSGLGSLMTGRGCPFRCRYCASHRIWTRKVRFRSADNVLAEMEYVRDKYGTTYFQFHDDTFTVNKQRAHQICDMIRSRGGIEWKCTTRTDCIDKALAEKMHASGCIEVSVGVESGSDRILESIEKGETKDDITKGCKILNTAGIPFVAFIMIGFPTETEDEAWETLNVAKSLGADSLCGSIVTPYPGTLLYDWAKDAGRLPESEEWSQYYHQSDGMGLWDLPADTARRVIRDWFECIEKYNHRPLRLAKRFWSKFKSDPLAAIRRSMSMCLRRFGK